MYPTPDKLQSDLKNCHQETSVCDDLYLLSILSINIYQHNIYIYIHIETHSINRQMEMLDCCGLRWQWGLDTFVMFVLHYLCVDWTTVHLLYQVYTAPYVFIKWWAGSKRWVCMCVSVYHQCISHLSVECLPASLVSAGSRIHHVL